MASDSHSSAQRSATETAVPNSPDLSGEAAKGASPSSPSSPNSRLIIASGSDNPPPIASSSDPKGKRKADTQTAIRQVATDVWTFSRPFARFGLIPVGGRSTAVRLNDGGVWVLASTPLDERTRERLQAMGEVKYVVAPDAVHHLYIADYARAFPSAKLIGVDGLPKKRKDVNWSGVYSQDDESAKYGYEDEIQARYFSTFANKDVAFCHVRSKSLIVADLMFNLPANEQYSATRAGRPTSWLPFFASLSRYLTPYTSLHSRFLWMAGAGSGSGSTSVRRATFARDASAVAKWEFERIIPCHGDVVEGDGKKAWLKAFERYIGPDGEPKL